MPKFELPGLGEIQTQGEGLSVLEFDAIKQIVDNRTTTSGVAMEEDTQSLIDPNTGYYNIPEVDTKIRFAVSAAPNLESKVKTLQKFYKDVKQDEFDASNFIVTDNNGKKFILDNKQKTNFGDVIDFGKDITGAITSTGGAIAGSVAGPAGTIAGAGAGLALGSELYERIGQLAGTEIDRTAGEYLATRAGEFALGSIAQGVAPLAIRGFKYVIRGGEKGRLSMQEAISDFKAVDPAIRPTLGMVTENKIIDSVENTLANVPFAAPLMRKWAEQTQNTMGEKVGELISKGLNFAKPATTEEAGVIVKQALGRVPKRGQGFQPPVGKSEFGVDNQVGWLGKFKNTSQKLYNDAALPDKTSINLLNTKTFLKKELGDTTGIESLAKIFQDNKLAVMLKGIEKLPGAEVGGTLNYKAAQQLKQYVGQRLASASLIDTTPRSAYKALYKSLSEDMAIGAEKVGPEALKKIRKADLFYKENIELWDDHLSKIAEKVDLDNLVPNLLKQSQAGSTAVTALTKGLDESSQKVLVSAFVDKLGKAKLSGNLDILERTNSFNTRQFLSNYGNMTPKAKDAIFGKSADLVKLRKNLDVLERAATRFEQNNPFMDLGTAAPKGTAGTGLIVGAGAAIATGATGNPLFLAGIPMFGYGGYFASKVMSNPAFVEWLAQSTKIAGNKGTEGIIEHLGKLGIIGAFSDNETRVLTDQQLEVLKKSAQNFEEKTTESTQQAAAQQQTKPKAPAMGPVNTNVTTLSPRASAIPSAPMTGQNKGDKYQGLFPFDTRGQAIARGQE
jgi:hypothetical protein